MYINSYKFDPKCLNSTVYLQPWQTFKIFRLNFIPCRTGFPGHCCQVCPTEETSTRCPSHWAQPAEYLQPHPTWLVDPPKQNTLTSKTYIQRNRITITEYVVFGWKILRGVYFHVLKWAWFAFKLGVYANHNYVVLQEISHRFLSRNTAF